jgi:hypothetical protein
MTPLPWSHSALSDFLNCPKAYYHKRVVKDVVDPPNEAGQWGDYVHKEFEKYLTVRRGVLKLPGVLKETVSVGLPTDLEQYREYLDALTALPGEMRVECKYAITKHLAPCDFFAVDVWCRAILDVIHINGEKASVLDHKTGKRKANTRQLKLSALMVFLHHPEVQLVKTGYFWLKDRAFDSEVYVRKNEADLWSEFLPDLNRYREAAKTMVFNPRPSGLCNGWCPVHACEYWKPKRR